MKALVTGASGFVGSAVVRHLLEQDVDVRVMLRPSSDRRNVADLPIEIVNGDLADAASLEKAVSGCDTLFHVAADYRLWVPDPTVLYDTNVKGSRNLMFAAMQAGVERIVYTSSVATLGINSNGQPADENTPSSLDNMVGHYKRSKFLAEQAVQQLIDEHQLPAVIVNPSTPVGPRDLKPTPTGRMVLDAACGRMPAYVDTGLNIVHVEDVAEGHWLALQKGRIGQRYILGGTDMSLRQILTEIAALTGRRSPRIRLPNDLLMPVAYAAETWARYSHGPEPRITRDGLRMAKKRMYFSSEKARRELGYAPHPAIDALRDAIRWFQQNHYCERHV